MFTDNDNLTGRNNVLLRQVYINNGDITLHTGLREDNEFVKSMMNIKKNPSFFEQFGIYPSVEISYPSVEIYAPYNSKMYAELVNFYILCNEFCMTLHVNDKSPVFPNICKFLLYCKWSIAYAKTADEKVGHILITYNK